MSMTISFCFVSFRRHRKARLAFFSIILLLCLILHPGTEAQLNFSTGWGKRNQRLEWGALKTECSSQTRPFLEQLLSIYQLIQVRFFWFFSSAKIENVRTKEHNSYVTFNQKMFNPWRTNAAILATS